MRQSYGDGKTTNHTEHNLLIYYIIINNNNRECLSTDPLLAEYRPLNKQINQNKNILIFPSFAFY